MDADFSYAKGRTNARADDTGNLTTAVVTWVTELYGTSTPALRATSKLERGLENDPTGQLICPAGVTHGMT